MARLVKDRLQPRGTVMPQAEVLTIAVELDMHIVVDRDDDSDLRLRLVRLLGVYPVHLVARMIRHARPGDSANVALRQLFPGARPPI